MKWQKTIKCKNILNNTIIKKDTTKVSFFFGANHASNAEYKIFILRLY
ncbi:hypothetical protein UNH65_02490 [Chitinophaga sp. 180180018-2]|nr:hypothetical protein [Chitinophaga sp. 212800010-3]